MATKKVRVRKPNEGEQPGFISKLSKYTKPKQEESQYSDEDIYKYIVTKIQDGDFPEQIIADLEKYKIPRGKVADTAYDLYDDYRRAEQEKKRASGKAPYDAENTYGEETASTEDETAEDVYGDEEDEDIQEAQDGGQFIGNSIFPKQTKPYYVGADAEPYDNAYKKGGAISKRSFIKKFVKDKLKKAAEGDEVQNNEFYLPPTGTINDPMGKYTQKAKLFAKTVQNTGNQALYKEQAQEAYNNYMQQMGGVMGQQDQHDPLEHLHIYGESLGHELTQNVSGTDNEFQFGGIKRLKEMGGNRRIRRANKALFGTPTAIPGVDVNYEFGPLGGLRKATADWDVSVLGDLVKFLPPRGGSYNSPFNTGYSMISTPAKMRDKVIKTVNNQALNEVAGNTPGSTATQNNTTSKKAELTCPPGATYDANKGYCVDMNGRMVFSPSTMLTKDPSELLTNPFVNPYADQIPGSYENLKAKQAKTNVLTNVGVSPLQANTQDPFNYAAAAFPGPDMSYGMDQSFDLPGPTPTQYSLNELGIDPATLNYDQYIKNKRAESMKRLNALDVAGEPINTVPIESSPMESLPAEVQPIENNSSTTFKPNFSVNVSNLPQQEFCYGNGCLNVPDRQTDEYNAMYDLAEAFHNYDPKNFNNITLNDLKNMIQSRYKEYEPAREYVDRLTKTKEGERFLNKWLEFQKERMQNFSGPINFNVNKGYGSYLLDPSSGVYGKRNIYSDFLSRYGKFKPGANPNSIRDAIGPLSEDYENYQTGGFIDSENPDLYKFIYGGDDIYEEGGYLPKAQYGDWAQNRFNTGFQPRYSKQRQRPSVDPAIMNPFAADGWRENATQNLMGSLNSGVQQPKTTTTTQPTTTTTTTTQPGKTTQQGTTQQGAPPMFNFIAPPSRRGIFGLTRDFNYGSGFSPVNWKVPEGATGVREVAYKDRGKWYNPFDTKRIKEYYAMGAPGTPGQPAGTPISGMFESPGMMGKSLKEIRDAYRKGESIPTVVNKGNTTIINAAGEAINPNDYPDDSENLNEQILEPNDRDPEQERINRERMEQNPMGLQFGGYVPDYMAYGGYIPEAKDGITVDQPEFSDPNYIGKVVEESAFSWNPKQLGADLFGGKMSLTGMLTSVGNAIKNEKNLFDPARKAGRSSDAASPNTGQGGFGSAEVVGSNMGDKGWLASNSGRNIQGIGFEGNEVITKRGGQLGSNYKKGSVYTLTAKQIQEIIAAGGKVEYIK
jgi:hypothetical protein